MNKGYWIVRANVNNQEEYLKYIKKATKVVESFNGKFLVRGGAQEILEGFSKTRTVLIEFPDLRAAKLCYQSAEYQKAQAIRIKYSVADLVIVEGH